MSNRTAILALAAAGLLWGLTVPLSKVALEWLGPGWLTVRGSPRPPRCSLWSARHGLRDAFVPRVVAAGALGFGAVTVLQNAGIERTSVSHAALVVGAAPVLVALIAAGLGRRRRGRSPGAATRWRCSASRLSRVPGAAADRGRRSARARVGRGVGDLHRRSARLLAGRDPAAVTAVQFAAAAVFATPVAVLRRARRRRRRRRPRCAPSRRSPLTGPCCRSGSSPSDRPAPRRARRRVVNLEPVVGATAGWLVMGRPPWPPSSRARSP